MKLKKIIALGMVAAMALSFTACGSKDNTGAADNGTGSAGTETKTDTDAGNTTADNDAADDTANLKGTVVITGSTSVDKIIVDMIDEFQAMNPEVTVNYTGTGSSAGIEDAIAGTNTLGVSSREVKQEELDKGIIADIFAHDGIAIAVNPKNAVADVTLEQLAQVYSGQITNWKDLGGADAPIVVVSREGASGTRSAFEELTGLEAAGGLLESATVVEGNGNVQTTVAKNENAIGYVSFSFIDQSVKALTLGGVTGTEETAKSGEYKLSRPFLFAYKADSLSPEGKAFVDFAKSADGQAFVEAHGGIKID